jgi:hypothetical protein
LAISAVIVEVVQNRLLPAPVRARRQLEYCPPAARRPEDGPRRSKAAPEETARWLDSANGYCFIFSMK